MGSSNYSLLNLNKLTNHFPVTLVATQPDKPVGRGNKIEPSHIKIEAGKLNIPVIQPKKINEDSFWDALKTYAIDLIIVAAYGKIFPKQLIDYPKFGCLNLHASLLPRWRGASPIQAAILNGDQNTGVTIMKMDEGIDTGPILSKKTVKIDVKDTCTTLSIKLAKIGSELLIECLPEYLEGKKLPQPQSDSGASYAGIIKKEDGLLDFSQPAELLENKIRAYNPWPICFMEWESKLMRIYSAEVSSQKKLNQYQRGENNNYPCIGTSTKDLILLEVQPSGKKKIDGKSFLNGARNWSN